MKTALNADPSRLDAAEKNVVDQVRTHGWFATYVATDEVGPDFSYTTGFWLKFQVPELIVFSLPQEVAHQICWNFYNALEAGERFSKGAPIEGVINNYTVYLIDVLKEHYPEFLGWNRWFYGGDTFEVQQLIWPNAAHSFPWSPEADADLKSSQPSLSERRW